MAQITQFAELLAKTIGISVDSSLEPVSSLTTSLRAVKSPLYPENALLTAEISSWISYSVALYSGSKDVTFLESTLNLKSFLVGGQLTLADFAVFVGISAANIDVTKMPSVFRWFDVVQHNQIPSSPFKRVSVARAPTIHFIKAVSAAAVQQPSEAVKQPAPEQTPSSSSVVKKEQTATATAEAPVPDAKDNKKAKKEKKEPETKTTAAPAADTEAGEDLDPSKLDIRVGKVVKCWNHPDSEKLLCEEIDVGDEGGAHRSIASGIRAFYSAGDVEGRLVLVLANLKERAIAGFKSQGMVLCASNPDHTDVRLLVPPSDAKVGDRVTFPGFTGEPAAPNQVAKKKIFEKLAPSLRTDSTGLAHWGTTPFTVAGQPVTSGLPDATVS